MTFWKVDLFPSSGKMMGVLDSDWGFLMDTAE
jgi:hypothetical protein